MLNDVTQSGYAIRRSAIAPLSSKGATASGKKRSDPPICESAHCHITHHWCKISLCFTYLLQKCMPTNHLNAYNNAPMGFPQRGRAQQACSVVLTTSFVDRQNGLCAILFTARSPDLHSCTAFFLKKGK